MLIYTNTKSTKKSKNTAKKRELQNDWNKLLARWEVKETKPTKTKPYRGLDLSHVRTTRDIPSLDTGTGNAVKKKQNQYTGTAMLGVATLHKSNAVPVFSQEDVVDIAKMRRG